MYQLKTKNGHILINGTLLDCLEMLEGMTLLEAQENYDIQYLNI